MWADHGLTPYGVMPAVRRLMLYYYKSKFRLFRVDFTNANRTRTAKKSVFVVTEVLRK